MLFALLAVAIMAPNKEEAGRHLERGNALFEAGNAEAALEAYHDAYAAYPSPKIRFNIAEAYRELDQQVEAAAHYENVIAELDQDSPLVRLSQERLDELDEQLGHLSVVATPDGADILVNGDQVGTSSVSGVRLMPGRLEVTAILGDEERGQVVELGPGQRRTLTFELLAIPLPDPDPDPDLAPDLDPNLVHESQAPIHKKWWFWAALAGGVALAAAGVTVAVTARGDNFVPGGELGTTSIDQWDQR